MLLLIISTLLSMSMLILLSLASRAARIARPVARPSLSRQSLTRSAHSGSSVCSRSCTCRSCSTTRLFSSSGNDLSSSDISSSSSSSGAAPSKGFGNKVALFKESTPMPSIDQLAKQQILKEKIKELDSGESTSPYDALEFPCEFVMKVIGLNDPRFVEDIVESVATGINQSPGAMKFSTKVTSGGKYLSISLFPVFRDSDEIKRCYKIVQADARVKYVL